MFTRLDCLLDDTFELIGGWIGPVNDTDPTPRVLELWRRLNEAAAADLI